MRKLCKTCAFKALALIILSGCATVSKTDVLLSNISHADAATVFSSGQMRDAADRVCLTFYKNSRAYIAETNKSSRGSNLVKAVGIGVLASVAARGAGVRDIDNTVGQIVAQQAIGTAVSQSSVLSLREIKTRAQRAQIEKVAKSLSCPLSGPDV